jgi:hypothetical protein
VIDHADSASERNDSEVKDHFLIQHGSDGAVLLPALAEKIRSHHQAALAAGSAALEHARDAGLALLEAKGKLSHGQFGSWVKANCGFSPRSATNYMKVAENWAALEAHGENGSVLPISSIRGFLSTKRSASDDGADSPAEEPVLDHEKRPVPARLRPVFKSIKVYEAIFRALKTVIMSLSELEDIPAGKHLDGIRENIRTLDRIIAWARSALPHVCAFCSDDQRNPKCESCGGDGWIGGPPIEQALEFEQGQ